MRDASFADPDEPKPTKRRRKANRGGRPRLQMTLQEREERRREQLRKGKERYKNKLTSSAHEDTTRKFQHQQNEKMRLALKKTPDHKRNKVNEELNYTIQTLVRETISEFLNQESKLEARVEEYSNLLFKTKQNAIYANRKVEQLERAYDWHTRWKRLIDEPAIGILDLQPELLELRKLTESQRLPDYWDYVSIKSQISEESTKVTRFSENISFLRSKAAQAIFECKDPQSLIKGFQEPQLQAVSCKMQGLKCMEERMAFYAENYLKQLSEALIENIKDRGIAPLRQKAMISYTNQESQI